MKRYILLVFIAVILLTCKDEPDVLFEMPFRFNIEIPAGLSTFEAHYRDVRNVNTNVMDLLAVNGIDASDIKKIRGKSARFTNLIGDADLDFIQEVSIRVFTEGPFIDQTEVFYRDNVPFDTDEILDIIPALPDVKEELLKERINVSIRFEFRTPPPTFVELRSDITFLVE